jgi:hypothetical protein
MTEKHNERRILNVLKEMALNIQKAYLKYHVKSNNPVTDDIYEKAKADVIRYNSELKQYE